MKLNNVGQNFKVNEYVFKGKNEDIKISDAENIEAEESKKSPIDPSFWQLQTGIFQEREKENFDKIQKLVENGDVSKEALETYMSVNGMHVSTRDLSELLDVLLKTENKKERQNKCAIFDTLMTSDLLKSKKINQEIMMKMLNISEAQHFALDYYANMASEDDGAFPSLWPVFSSCYRVSPENADDVTKFIEYNIQTKDVPLSRAISLLDKYSNPKTELFDNRIYELSRNLKEANPNFHCFDENIDFPHIVQACIDKNTGEIDKSALDFLHKYYFEVNDPSKFENQKRKVRTFSPYVKARSLSRDFNQQYGGMDCFAIAEMLDVLKDNQGSFNKKNIAFVSKYANERSIKYCTLNNFFKHTKDENGIIDKNLYKYILRGSDCGITAQGLEKILEICSERGPEKSKAIFESLENIYEDERNVFANYPVIAKKCFDKDGIHFDEDNLNFVIDVANINQNTRLCEEIFDVVQNEDNRNLILEMLEKDLIETYSDMDFVAFSEIVQEYGDEEGNIHPFVKEKMFEAMDCGLNPTIFHDLFNACFVDSNFEESFDFKKFEMLTSIFSKSKPFFYEIKVTNAMSEFLSMDYTNENLNFKTKINILTSLSKIRNEINDPETLAFIDETLKRIDLSLNCENISLPISNADKIEFKQSVMGRKGLEDNGLTHFENVLKDNIPTLKQMNNGINLLYPRKDFLSDLSIVCDDEEKLKILSEKTSIDLKIDKEGKIQGYNGVILLDNLNREDELENQIYNLCHEFLYSNEAKTGNEELDNELNKIIKACPEFINTIGKKQHGTQKYSLDVHQLLMLANSINNPDYLNLNDTDKMALKLTAIFHDITKPENQIDKNHQNTSAIYTRSIIKKFINSQETRDRIYELVKNHHWLEEYSYDNSDEKASEIAFRFRRPNDFDISKIMAKSDLMAVSEDFYERHKDALSAENMEKIEDKLQKLYSYGDAIFSDYPMAERIGNENIETYEGYDYKVINFNEIGDDENLFDYGFKNGLTKNDVKLLVHMVNDRDIYSNLNTISMLTSSINKGVLSESLITPKYKRTYCNRKYGVLLSQINPNIVSVSNRNQGSGCEKNFNNAVELVFQNRMGNLEGFREILLKNLDIEPNLISDEEFAKFYKENILTKSALSQIQDDIEYEIGKFKVKGEDIKSAINKYQEILIDKEENSHNEIVGYAPKIQAVVAKEKSLSKVPSDLLKFARENNLPIVLI